MNPELLFPIPMSVQSLSTLKNCTFFNFSGQALDRLWIRLSSPCPSDVDLDVRLTGLGPSWDRALTNPLQDLFLDRHWTGLGHRLDKDWILRPVSVQPTIGQLYPKVSMQIEKIPS